MRGCRKFRTFTLFFFVCLFFFGGVFLCLMRGGRIQKLLLAGHHLPVREMSFKQPFAGVPYIE